MDFLLRQYEKLILVACMFCLIVCTKMVKDSNNEALQKEREAQQEVKTIIKARKLCTQLDPNALDKLEDMLLNPTSKVDIIGNNVRTNDSSALFRSVPVILCKNNECKFLLPMLTADTCPECGTKQDPIGAAPTDTDDLDKDGIPDVVEKDTEGLHYRYPKDAMADFDQDGFLNIEEYTHGTNMNDANDFPSLAIALRRQGKPTAQPLPFTLKRIKDSGGSSDHNFWKAVFEFKGQRRPVEIKLSDATIGKTTYKLVKFDDDKHGVTVADAKGATYHMEANSKTVQERVKSVNFVFLDNRSRYADKISRTAKQMTTEGGINVEDENANDDKTPPRRRPDNDMDGGASEEPEAKGVVPGTQMILFTLHVGDVFFLEKASKDGEGVVEAFRVLPVETKGNLDIVKVQQVDAASGAALADTPPVEIPLLDESEKSKDFIYEEPRPETEENAGEDGESAPAKPVRRTRR